VPADLTRSLGRYEIPVFRLGRLAIDAKDEAAPRWYARFGALPFRDDPLKLVLPLSVIADVIQAAEAR
jgi:hypothetical protein